MSINPFRALQRHKNFRLFWSGQTLSLVGSWMQSVAQGWLALQLTDDAFKVGLVSAAGSLPVLLFSLLAGALVDRSSKLRLVLIAQTLLLAQAALLWWFTMSGRITFPWLLGLATFAGVVTALDIPARQSLLIELVGRDDLLDAIALNSTGFNLARIVGPGIAAVIIARAGLAWCFGVNALSYLAVLIALLTVRLPAMAVAPVTMSAIASVREGLRYVRTTPKVASLMRFVAVYSVFGLPYLILMPVIARNVLGTGAAGYGLLLSSVGVGAVIGALALAAVGQRMARERLLAIAAPAFGATLIAFSFVRSVPVATVLLLFAGLAMILTSALANSLLQSVAPDAMRGRVMSAYTFVFVGVSPIGAFVGGAVARAVGADWAVGAGGAVVLVYAVISLRDRRGRRSEVGVLPNPSP